ncbi:tRNA (guanosine(46)-N7)-methyltransferase TrmB [Piscicoccus intestinalis]|uniref:tRNA (guanosine(46)-N7)-methyltransferase TrmB n=1 Tax=Piscicoccus intestinalis TaxID=746033 RepID=UPI000B27C2FE|nr:tRNA (guanosine(46)-N7)-methyltransferase TrmB [Piscicoccus intestinalis]
MSLGADSVEAGSSGEWPRREVVSFGRRDGRRRGRFARQYPPHLDRLVIVPSRGERAASLAPGWVFDAPEAFGRDAPLVVEIGSGTGEAVLASARARPDVDHLAVEVYRPGAARTVARAGAAGLTNVRVIEADARALVAGGLAEGSVAEVRVFFPDPWPKARHHKRRLVDEAFVADATRVLSPGGVLRLATDWEHYAHQMRRVADACPALESATPPQSGGEPGWARRFAGRPETTFERKGLRAGRRIYDLEYRRRAG